MRFLGSFFAGRFLILSSSPALQDFALLHLSHWAFAFRPFWAKIFLALKGRNTITQGIVTKRNDALGIMNEKHKAKLES